MSSDLSPRQNSSLPSLAKLASRRLHLLQAQANRSTEPEPVDFTCDPVEYIRDKLGIKLWYRQVELIERTWAKTIAGCISGQKTGKTLCAAGIAIAWCKLHRRGVVRLASASEDQLIDGLWGEIRSLLLEHPDLGPPPNLAPSTGWHPSNDQKIIGVTAKEANRMAGRSGAEQLWIVDEACGIDYPLWEVILGNLMGGGHLLWLTNPVSIGGKIYEWDTNPDSAASIIRIDARETPNFPGSRDYVEGVTVPGLATPEGVETIRKDYGEDSAEFDVRVRGRFPRQGSNAAIPLGLVEDAVSRPRPEDNSGPLMLGIDVARFGDDDSCIVPRRGLVAQAPRVFRGLPIVARDTEECLKDKVVETATELREGKEVVFLAVDSSGLGAGLVDALMALDEKAYDWLVVIPVNAAESAHEEDKYFNRRTELWFNGREWLKVGCIEPDQRLKGELIAPRYGFDPKNRRKLESKDDIKKRTKKSPDVADAFLLSLVNPPEPDEYNAEACVRPYQSPINY